MRVLQTPFACVGKHDGQFWNVKDSSQAALAFVQGLASSQDPGSVCACCVSASVQCKHDD